jgi:hypothetical protein
MTIQKSPKLIETMVQMLSVNIMCFDKVSVVIEVHHYNILEKLRP